MKRTNSITPNSVVAMLSWLVAVAAAWLAVGDQFWAQTLLLAAVGGLYLCFPPSGTFPRSLLILFGLLLLLAITAFTPADWGGGAIRQSFLDHGIILPDTISAQPWLSLEDLTLLFATLLWAWSCFEAKLTLDQREFLSMSFLAAMGLVAVSTIIRGPGFLGELGQFSNRNQTGDILVMAGIFSFVKGVADLSKRKSIGLFWIGITILFMAATFRNGSRAAVILFTIGLVLSFGLMPRSRSRHRSRLSYILAGATCLAGMMIFGFAGGELKSRFLLMFTGGQEGRIPIYRDAIAMVIRGPWCGVGLGNFEGIFNTQRVDSALQMTRCLHPESDWLWVAVELGLFGVLILALIVALTFRVYLGKSPFPALTKICTTIALLFLIHSFFDVSGHRLGTIWSCLYLVSLGAFRPVVTTDARIPPIVLRMAGVILLAVAYLRVQSMSVEPLVPTEASVATVKDSLVPQVSPSKQMELIDRAILWAPLDFKLYYERALVGMNLADSSNESADDFKRALFLEENSIALPIDMGEECRNSNFSESLLAWKALLQRAGPRREEFFKNLYGYSGLPVKAKLEMTTLAEGDPDLEAISVINEDPPEFDWLLQNLLESNPSLKGVSPAAAEQLFDHWVKVGNADQFLADWPLHPEWHVFGWKAYAMGLAQDGRYKEAVTTVLSSLPVPKMAEFREAENVEEAERKYQDNPRDPLVGIHLYFAQMKAGMNDEALTTLIALSRLPHPPAYIRYLLAKNQAAADQDEAAWNALEPLLVDDSG